jgi:hypothetical protein
MNGLRRGELVIFSASTYQGKNRMGDINSNKPPYERGCALGKWWIATGGKLDADGPEDTSEEFYNGFIDTLADERRRIAKV